MKSVFLSLLFSLFSIIIFAQKPVIQAVLNGDVQQLETLIAQGADVNETNDNGWFPLAMLFSPDYTSKQEKKLKIASLLLENGADANRTFEDIPLATLAFRKDLRLANLLLDFITLTDQSLIDRYIQLSIRNTCADYQNISKLLEFHSGNLSYNTIDKLKDLNMELVIKCGYSNLLIALHQKGFEFPYKNSLLSYAVLQNDVAFLDFLTQHYPCNVGNLSVLNYYQAFNDKKEINWERFKNIVQQQNIERQTASYQYDLGNFLVTYNAPKAIFQFCIKEGIRFDVKGTEGATVIMLAAQTENQEVFELLAQTYPKAIFDTDDLGWTVYDYALWLPYLEDRAHIINDDFTLIKLTSVPRKDNVDKYLKDSNFTAYLKSLGIKRGSNYLHIKKINPKQISQYKELYFMIKDDRFDYFNPPIEVITNDSM